MDFDVSALVDFLHYSADEFALDDMASLEYIFEEGKLAISEICGFPVDYKESAKARELVLNWCRYRLNNASEYFEQNFRHEINEVRHTAKAREVVP